MIVVKQERIYGIDVYSFKSSKGTPFQLIFDEQLSGRYHDVSLFNLKCQSDSPYCKEVRQAISDIAFNNLLDNRCTLFFSLEYSSNKKLRLLIKFLRWIALDKRVLVELEITKLKEIEFIEAKIFLKPDFIKSLKVIE